MGMHWGTPGKALGDTHGANVLTPHGLHLWAMAQGPREKLGLFIPKKRRKETGKIFVNPQLQLQISTVKTWG